jgi:hypothetical protein
MAVVAVRKPETSVAAWIDTRLMQPAWIKLSTRDSASVQRVEEAISAAVHAADALEAVAQRIAVIAVGTGTRAVQRLAGGTPSTECARRGEARWSGTMRCSTRWIANEATLGMLDGSARERPTPSD